MVSRSSLKEIVNFIFNKSTLETRRTHRKFVFAAPVDSSNSESESGVRI